MKLLSELKNEEALDFIADAIEPLAEIFSDPEFKTLRESKPTKIAIIQWVLKFHKKEVLEVLAVLDGVPVEEYEVSAIEIPVKILAILNDKELVSLFTSQSQMNEKTSSGSATENTEAEEL